jgi:hypothetical protein
MPERAHAPEFQVRLDPSTIQEDLKNARAAGRAMDAHARQQLERQAVAVSLLAPCEIDPRDGTDLPGVVKLYPPEPYAPWGLVQADIGYRNGATTRASPWRGG